MNDLIKKDWLERATATFKFHRSRLTSEDKWTATLTAKALNRSIGSISEDLKIARWYRTNKADIDKFDYSYEALEWIREKEKKMSLEE